jgi:hypothetical protein
MLRLSTLTEILLYSAALLGYLPLAPWLQRFPAFAVPAAIIFAVFAGRKGLILREKPALLVSAAGFFYYALQFSRHSVAEPAANLLAILLAIRLAGDKSPRNFLQSITLALFCLAASTLFDLSPRFVIYLLLLLLIFTISLVLLTFRSSVPDFSPARSELRAILSVAMLQPLLALPLIILLFFILPRTQFPIWQSLSVAGNEPAGISDTVQPGDKSAVSSGKATLFRAEMAQLSPDELYWRVTVLNAIKGSSWVRRAPPPDGATVQPHGREVSQTIFLEPGRIEFLPALNIPKNIAGARSGPTGDRLFPALTLPMRRRSYSVVSQITTEALPAGRVDRQFYTVLPENTPPRLIALSREVASRGKNGEQRLRLLEKAFLDLKLSYATSGLPTGANAIDTFLFVDKKGHCELFATSFATALRGAGVPARLVGGYYGGDYNELAGYYAVAEERAHLWVEAWLEGKGWVTVDPSRFAANFAETRRVKGRSLALRLRILADTLNYFWNRAVITYDLESQFAAVSKAGEGLRSLKTGDLPLRRLAIGISCLLLLAAGFNLARRKRLTPEERLLKRFRRLMRRRFSLDIAASSGLHEAVTGINNEAVQEFVSLYTGAIYRDRRLTKSERVRLEELLVRIRQG